MYPVIETSTGGSQTSATTSHTINVPSGLTSGDLILVFFLSTGNNTHTPPSGYSTLFSTFDADSSVKSSVWYKISDGSETATTATTDFSLKSVHTTLRVSGVDTATSLSASSVNGVLSSAPNPPSVTASWGSDTNLYLAIGQWTGFGITVSSPPTGYASVRSDHMEGGASSDLDNGIYYKEATSSSEDPSAFSMSTSAEINVFTLAIKPAAASSPAFVPFAVFL